MSNTKNSILNLDSNTRNHAEVFDRFDNQSFNSDEIDNLSNNSIENGIISKEIKILEKICLDMNEKSDEWFKLITLVRYKYSLYYRWNNYAYIFIILMSSTITFLEAIRNNIKDYAKIDFIFTLITLSLGFLIAVITAIIKFLNIQSIMEELRTVTTGLEKSYESVNKLIAKTNLEKKLNYNKEKLDKLIDEVKEAWIKILTETVKDQNNINNIINPDNMSSYLIKFYKSENINKLIVTNHNRHVTVLNKIGENIIDIEKKLLEMNSNKNIEFLPQHLDETLENLNLCKKNIKDYKNFIRDNFSHSLLYTKPDQFWDCICNNSNLNSDSLI